MFGKHGKLADYQRQFAIFARLEGELDRPLARPLHLFHTGIIIAVEGIALFAQRPESPDHVLDRNGLAVMPSGLRSQGEGDPRAVLRYLDRLAQQAIFRERLVEGVRHHGIVDQPQRDGGLSFDDESVERIVTADGRQPYLAAFRRRRVDVVEIPEPRRVFQVAMHGEAVALPGLRSLGGACRQRGGKQEGYGCGGETIHLSGPYCSITICRECTRKNAPWQGECK